MRGARGGATLVALLALQAIAPARADAPLWELGLGVAALRMPHYRGAAQSRDWVLPLPYAVYRGEILRADREGARAVFVDTGRFEVDVSAAASAPTDSRDDEARRGMPDLDPTVEFGPSANLTLARGAGWTLKARLPLRAAFTLRGSSRHVGWSATPNLSFDREWRGWNLGAQAAVLAGDRRLHGYFYDVAPADATAERPAYRARAGGAGWQATLGASRRFDSIWFGAFVRADSVRGAAFAASPLVRRRDNVMAGFGVSWVFAASERRVSEVR